jgi:PAS domain S-box-containing protein
MRKRGGTFLQYVEFYLNFAQQGTNSMPLSQDALQAELESLRQENRLLKAQLQRIEPEIPPSPFTEQWLDVAMRGGKLVLWCIDIEKDSIEWFPSAYKLYSSPNSVFDGTIASFFERIHPDDRPVIQQAVLHSRNTGEDYHVFFRLVLPGMPVRWMESHGVCRPDETGKVRWILGATHDVTEQKQLETAILNTAQITLLAISPQEVFEGIASQLAHLMGADMTIVGRRAEAESAMVESVAFYKDGTIQPSITYPLEGTPCERVFGKQICFFHEQVASLFPGDTVLVEERIEGYAGIPLFNSKGEPIGLMNALWRHPIPNTDFVTSVFHTFASRTAFELERQEMNRELEEQRADILRQNRIFHEAQSIAQVGGFAYEFSTQKMYWTEEMYRIFEVEPEDFVPSRANCISFFTNENFERIRQACMNSILTNTPFEIEVPMTTAKGRGGWVRIGGTLYSEANEPSMIYGACREITRRRLSQQELQTSRANLLAVVESIPDMILSLDREYRFLTMNTDLRQAFANAFGTHPEAGDFIGDFIPKEMWETWKPRYDRTLAGEAFHIEEQVLLSDGYLHTEVFFQPILEEGEVTGAVVFARNVTERVRLQEELQQSLKMEGLGRLAGGIAHDFNNILTAIMGYSEMVYDSLPKESPLKNYTQQIMHAGEKAATLTAQLLAFARKQLIQPQLLSISEALPKTIQLLKRLIGEDVTLSLEINSTEGLVRIDPGQLEQLLINLAINARDAMPQGGTITIHVDCVDGNHQSMKLPRTLPEGKYCRIAVSDTGIGMGEEVQKRVFEPFFTTKPVGKGTGLGLSICYGVVQQAGGTILVESAEGEGATFYIFFPLVEGVAPVYSPIPLSVADCGGETILLVEDEPMVRQMASEVLRAHGYEILVAASGEEALSLAESATKPIDILVTDVVMPQMSGKQVADTLLARQPTLKVLYVSGYTEDAIVHHQVLQEGITLLPKPFTPLTLSHKIREVLDGK